MHGFLPAVLALTTLAPPGPCLGHQVAPPGVPREGRTKAQWEEACKKRLPSDAWQGLVINAAPAHVDIEPWFFAGWSEECGDSALKVCALDGVWSLVTQNKPPVDSGRLEIGDTPGESHRVTGLPDVRDQIPAALYDAVAAIHASPEVAGATFDPVNLIRAVNVLHAMGKDRALEALEAYIKLCDTRRCSPELRLEPERVYPIMQILFVRKDGIEEMPPMGIGMFSVYPSEESTAWPLFPIAIEGDVPFCFAEGRIVAGGSASPDSRIWFCREECHLRDRPLAPSIDPCAAAGQIARSGKLDELVSHGGQTTERLTKLLYQQAIKGAGALVGEDWSLLKALSGRADAKTEEAWAQHAAAVATRQPVWDPERQDFVAGAPTGR